jgi:molecular chaperone HtpG
MIEDSNQTILNMNTGKINVQTENIFPIIKKFLYSDHEIFLRELVSNAVDASQKLKSLASMGEFKGDLGELFIDVAINKEEKTITIRDRGLGMTGEEIVKYIAQIAFSGAEEFIEKYKDKTDTSAVIGHFGLGFYSAFMVAKQVEIRSLSYKEGSVGALWTCDGSPEYNLSDIELTERGTEITLRIAEDSEEFLENEKIEGLLKKYCKFLPISIRFGTKTEYVQPTEEEKAADDKAESKEVEVDNFINNPTPAWTKKPADLSDEDYKKFYRELYPMVFEDPLFHIHLNVDFPFNLTGILYFPKLNKSMEVQKDKIQLYSRQVFVTDNLENIVPEFLTFMRGVIDSPDIPLNVSRSYLQADGNVKKISAHITKKVGDKLEEIYKSNREDFESKWDDIRIFVQYGMMTDDKFYDKAKNFALLKSTEEKYSTIAEYQEKTKANQVDKNGVQIFLYTNDPEAQHSYIAGAKDKGYDVLEFDNAFDSHYIQQLESKLEKTQFVRVDANTPDKLIEKDEPSISKLTEDESKTLKEIFEKVVNKSSYQVQIENLSETDSPIMLTQTEFMRRMKDMSKLGGGMSFYGNMPDSYNLVLNSNHSLMGKILAESDVIKKENLAKQATDLALLGQGLLKGEELTNFVKRSVAMIN